MDKCIFILVKKHNYGIHSTTMIKSVYVHERAAWNKMEEMINRLYKDFNSLNNKIYKCDFSIDCRTMRLCYDSNWPGDDLSTEYVEYSIYKKLLIDKEE